MRTKYGTCTKCRSPGMIGDGGFCEKCHRRMAVQMSFMSAPTREELRTGRKCELVYLDEVRDD